MCVCVCVCVLHCVQIQLKEKDDLVSTLERCLRHCRSELQRRLALQEREHRKQLEVAAREEGQEGGTGKRCDSRANASEGSG